MPPKKKTALPAAPAATPPSVEAKASPSSKTSKFALTKKANEDKWGKVNMSAGWTCIPNILIQRQKTLGLDATDLNILLHLMTFWWEDENLPHPSKARIAEAMGISTDTVQRHIREMEKGGLINRIYRPQAGAKNDTNLYDLTPLRSILEPHAQVEISERQATRNARNVRATKVVKAPAPGNA